RREGPFALRHPFPACASMSQRAIRTRCLPARSCTPCNSLEHLQGLCGASPPRESRDALPAGFREPDAQLRIIEYPADTLGDILNRLRIDQDGGAVSELLRSVTVGGYHRTVGRHRLQ